MNHSESQLQRACVSWFRLQYPHHILMAIPNGGRRNKIEAAIMRAEGVLAGASDLLLMHPNDQYHGLCLEMKAGKGVQTESQKEFARKAWNAGYQYVVCRSFDEFMNEVNAYLR